MMRSKAFTFGLLLVLPIIIFITGCERSTDPHGHEEMDLLIVRDRTQTARPVIAEWTHDAGWNVNILYELSLAAERVSLGVEVYDNHGNELELQRGGVYEIRYWIAQNAPEGIIDLSLDENLLFHGDHVHIYGAAVGDTQIQFLLWHGDHADAATDPITFRVVE